MNSKSKLKRVIEATGVFILIIVITYAFLCLCNWDYQLKEWNGFSRFVLGAIGFFGMLNIIDEL